MENSIIGTWVSRDLAGDIFQKFTFHKNGSYEMNYGSDPEKVYQGHYKYEDDMLKQFVDSKTEMDLGYVAINGNEMIEGLKHVNKNDNIEGDWIIDTNYSIERNREQTMVKIHYTAHLKNGKMKIVRTTKAYQEKPEVRTYTSDYQIDGDSITISNSTSDNPLFADGTNKICIINDVLLPINKTTCHSYFTKEN